MLASVHCTDLQNMFPASVHYTDLQFFKYIQRRYNVQAFNSLYDARLGTLCLPLIFYTLPASVHCTDL